MLCIRPHEIKPVLLKSSSHVSHRNERTTSRGCCERLPRVPFLGETFSLDKKNRQLRRWLKLVEALTQNSLLKGIKQASPVAQTSYLEGNHSVVNQFAPKMLAYSYLGMLCRRVTASAAQTVQFIKQYSFLSLLLQISIDFHM